MSLKYGITISFFYGLIAYDTSACAGTGKLEQFNSACPICIVLLLVIVLALDIRKIEYDDEREDAKGDT